MNTELSDYEKRQNKKKNIAGVLLGLIVLLVMVSTIIGQVTRSQGL